MIALLASLMFAVAESEEVDAGSSLLGQTLSTGVAYTCALAVDQTVQCWGRNNVGQLGDGTTTDRLVATEVVGISNAVAVYTGYFHSCAVLDDGTAKCWGQNDDGELGDGTQIDSSVPVAVAGLSNISSMALSANNSCAVLATGTVKCWGGGSAGQNGNGSFADRLTPVTVVDAFSNPISATEVAAGQFHLCAIRTVGGVMCWGHNQYGQVSQIPPSFESRANTVPGLFSGVTNLGLSAWASCAVMQTGEVNCWGRNGDGELGNGTTTDSWVRGPVTGLTDAVQISGGWWNMCATRSNGEVSCWGRQDNIDANGTPSSLVPIPVVGVTNAEAVTSALSHSCADVGSAVVCWGDNGGGQLGNNSTTTPPTGTSTAVGVAPAGSSAYDRYSTDILGSAASTSYTGDPVGTALGNFFDRWEDLPAPAKAFGLDVHRWYNSVDSRSSELGMGWRTSWSETVSETPSGDVELTLAEGRTVVFEPDGSGGFDPALEFGGLLSVDGGGLYSVTMSDDEVWNFDADGLIESRTRWDGVDATVTRDGSNRVSTVTASTGESVTFNYTGSGQLDSIQSSDGRLVDYSFDPTSGFLTGVTGVDAKTTVIEPDASGRVVKITDPTGVVLVHNGYDVAGRVGLQVTPQGTTSFVYDTDLRTAVVTQEDLSESITYAHDELGRVVTITDESLASATRTYDSAGWLDVGEDRRGAQILADFDARGNPQSITDPKTGTSTIDYDTEGRVDEIDVPGYGTSTLGYDGNERVPSTITDANNKVTTQNVVDGLVRSQTDPDGVTLLFRYYPNRLLHEVEDEYGNITEYEYDGAGRRAAVELPSGARTVTEYDDAGRVTKVTAADTGETVTEYDDAGRVDKITDPENGVTDYDYDPVTGLLDKITDPMLRVTEFEFDDAGRMKKTTYADATYSENIYGDLGRIDTVKDELLRETDYEYDAEGNITLVRDPEGGEVETVYDPAGRVDKVFDAADRETDYGYDPATGQLETITGPTGATTYTYDDVGRVETVTDLRGGVTTTTYTDAGRVDTVEDPAGLVTDYDYDDAGRLSKLIEPGNRQTVTEYNSNSWVAKRTTPEGNETTYQYDGVGRVLSETDPAGVVTTNTWTKRGELATQSTSGAGEVEFHYFADGNLEWVDDALDYRTTFVYDSRGRLEKRIDPAGQEWVTDYNPAGEMQSATDPLSRTTLYGYDDAGRLETVADASGRVHTNVWRLDGLLDSWSSTDGVNNQAGSISYDADGRRRTQSVDGRTWTYGHNAAGDLTSVTNPDGRALSYEYDDAGRRTQMRRADGRGVSYSYDTAGRVDKISPTEAFADSFTAPDGNPDIGKWIVHTNAGGTAEIENNEAKLSVTSTANSWALLQAKSPANANGDSTFSYQFESNASTTRLRAYQRYLGIPDNFELRIDSDSSTARIYRTVWWNTLQIATFTVPVDTDKHKVRFLVDGGWVLAKVWDDGEDEPATWNASAYDGWLIGAASPRIMVQNIGGPGSNVRIDDFSHNNPGTPNGNLVDYNWDNDGNLTEETIAGGGQRDWTWTDGQLTGFQQTAPGVVTNTTLGYDSAGRLATETTGGVTTTYAYDPANQLLSETPTGGTATTWTYDNRGSRTSETQGAVTTSYTYDNAAQLTATTPTGGTPTVHLYDQAGRRSSDTTGTDVTTYTYNPEGQLAALTLPSGDSQIRAYDPEESPDRLTNTIAGAPDNWTLDWDHTQGLAELSALLQHNPTSNNSITQDLTRTPDAPWATNQFGGTTHALPADHEHSTLPSILSTLGTDTTYTPWGQPETATPTLEPTLGYRGEVNNHDLVHLRAREYQPSAATFTTTDPLDGIPGTPVLNNPYHYTNNNPLNLTDPSGMAPHGDQGFALGGTLAFQQPSTDPGTLALLAGHIAVLATLAPVSPATAVLATLLLATVLLARGDTVGHGRDKQINDCINGPDVYTPPIYATPQEVSGGLRATGVVQCLTPTHPEGKPAASYINPPGWNSLPSGSGGNLRARGHLIARSLGGDGTERRNLVALHRSANQSMFVLAEQPVLQALRLGRNVWYEVTPNYGPPSGPLYPTSVSITASSLAPGANLAQTVPNEP